MKNFPIENLIVNIQRVVYNMFSQFEVDKIVIGKEEIDYYNNFYLKGRKHTKFTTK